MKIKIKKRHIVLTALVLALGAAVYLNWQFGSSDFTSEATQTGNSLGEATYVSTNEATVDQQVVKMTTEQEQYFAQAENKRKEAEDEVIEISKEVLTLSESSDEAKTEAVEKADEIEKRILNQSNIESVLNAKGFSRCLCLISDEGCNVIVLKDEMNESSTLIIKDAVSSQIEMDFDDIKVVEI